MEFFRRRDIFVLLIAAVILTAGVFFIIQGQNYFVKQPAEILGNSTVSPGPSLPPPPHKLSNPPKIVKAIYVTGYSAGSSKYLKYLKELFKTTEINAVVVDIKDYSGAVSYASGAADVKKYKLSDHAINDIDALVNFFHDQNIYVIGRITTFEDPAFSGARKDLAVYDKAKTAAATSEGQPPLVEPILWKDNNGLSWLDPASKDAWDYNISLAKDAFSHGFDEMNFDYIRFPTDGKAENMGFPIWDSKTTKANVIKSFFVYLRQELKGEKISVDLFGQTTTNKDDMGIGQLLENAFENFDYISPMVYPSHYINGFLGFANPADHPYEMVKYSMASALSRELAYLVNKQKVSGQNSATPTNLPSPSPSPSPAPIINYLAKFRPWLQDFNMGATYSSDMVKLEIKATEDALGNDFEGFMLWNASNIYTQDAVLKPN